MGALTEAESLVQWAERETSDRVQEVLGALEDMVKELVESDAVAHASIVHAQGQPVSAPQGGYIQLGFVLYWAKYPPAGLEEILKLLPKGIQELWSILTGILVGLHPPTVTQAEYTYMLGCFGSEGVVDPNGQVLSTGRYEGADLGWIWSVLNYLVNLVSPSDIAPFCSASDGDPVTRAIELPEKGSIKIAVLGDWGTGSMDAGGGYDPALSVRDTIVELQPDIIVHLGDVYYAGTEDRLPAGEEQQFLIDLWPAGYGGKSYTLNSNHEMCGGANGYFNIALGRAGASTPFESQGGRSFFALSLGDYAVVGLDSAYFDPSPMYIRGALGNRADAMADEQYRFLEKTAKNHKHVILMSHHTGMTPDGVGTMPMWNDVAKVVDTKKIHSWIWGHIHAGIAYGSGSLLGRQGIRAYCVGHSAIPIGAPWGMQTGNSVVDWVAQTPVGGTAYSNRVRNGFAMLTIDQEDASVAFYDEGSRVPVWPPTSAK